MFEKEAEKWADKLVEKGSVAIAEDRVRQDIQYTFRKSAEFGYNKANEWHFVNWKYFADKNCPKSESASYLVQLRNKDTLICEWETEEGFGCFWDSDLNPIDNDDVYAWKEIVLPKEIKEND